MPAVRVPCGAQKHILAHRSLEGAMGGVILDLGLVLSGSHFAKLLSWGRRLHSSLPVHGSLNNSTFPIALPSGQGLLRLARRLWQERGQDVIFERLPQARSRAVRGLCSDGPARHQPDTRRTGSCGQRNLRAAVEGGLAAAWALGVWDNTAGAVVPLRSTGGEQRTWR